MQVALVGFGPLGVLLGLSCSSTSSPVERGRSPVVDRDAGQGSLDETVDASNGTKTTSPATVTDPTASPTTPENTASENTAPEDTAPEDTASDGTATDQTPLSPPGEYWALVRSEDSQMPFAEEWTYDELGRLVKARVALFRITVGDGWYANDITITYDGNHVTTFHDRAPEEIVDLRYDYQLQDGRVVEYEEVRFAGLANEVDEVTDRRTFVYDDAGRLSGSVEGAPANEVMWTLERRDGGVPDRLLRNGEVACLYSWRDVWLGTTCYVNGVVSQTYEADASELLARVTFDAELSTDYGYDDEGHLTSQTNGTYVDEYRYSDDAKLLVSRGPDYEEVRSYDDAGLLQEVRWSYAGSTSTTVFTYERVSVDEVVETATSADATITRTFERLPYAPTGEPQLPSYETILRMVQPSVYLAPVDYSRVQ